MRRLWLCIPLLACASTQSRPESPAAGTTPTTTAFPAVGVAAPPPAPHEDDTRVEDWQGLRIVVRRRPKAELVTTEVVIRGGLPASDPATVGVERLAIFTAASGGTEQLPKEAFQKRLARLGSTLEARADADGSALEAKSLAEAWPETFDLLVDAFLNPALPASELELQRARQLRELRRIEEEPDLLLVDLGRRAVFDGTPYAQRVLGTKDTVPVLTIDDVRRQLQAMRTRNRLLVVVVGNVHPDAVVARARAAFGTLPSGSPLPPPVARPRFSVPRVSGVQRPLPTNYLLAQVPGPAWNEPEFVTGLVAARILGDREFEAIRTKRNLTYAVAAGLISRQRLPLAVLYVTAVDPATTWRAMQEEVRRLQEEEVESERLSGAKAELRTRWLMDGESTDGEAQQLARAELLGGDWRLQRTVPDGFPAVTGPQVMAYARRWFRGWQVAVVGDPAKVDVAMFH
jgi:zinc protease